jgi:uncharacterized protein
MELRGRTVLLTGATGGLGHAIARRLAAEGATLVLTGRRAEVLEPLAAELGGRAVACDLADRAAVARLAAEQAGVDVLVANAALPASGALASFSVEELDRALDVNLRAPMVLAHALTPGMVERGAGHVVLMSSLSGKSGQAGTSVYSATKFGLRGLGQGLREDLHGTGVGVSAVFPGFISDAGMFHDTQTTLPRGVGTSTPGAVADAVLRGIREDRAELDVAPASMRVGTAIAGLAPQLAARVTRRSGSGRISAEMAERQRHLR